MSTSEITAWNLGVSVAKDTPRAQDLATIAEATKSAPLTEDEQAALHRLGPQKFAYWALQGARDALRERNNR